MYFHKEKIVFEKQETQGLFHRKDQGNRSAKNIYSVAGLRQTFPMFTQCDLPARTHEDIFFPDSSSAYQAPTVTGFSLRI